MNPNEPLGLPRGSVRALLALGLTAAVVAGVFAQLPLESVAVIAGLATAAVAFYFKDRPQGGE